MKRMYAVVQHDPDHNLVCKEIDCAIGVGVSKAHAFMNAEPSLNCGVDEEHKYTFEDILNGHNYLRFITNRHRKWNDLVLEEYQNQLRLKTDIDMERCLKIVGP